MARAWPFEDVPEGGRNFRTPADYAAWHGEGIEAVIVRIGLHDAQLVLVDSRGAWQRWVYHSMEEAREAVSALDVPLHEGEYPEALRVRINSYQRPTEDFDRAAYPEQGKVGPVLPWSEASTRTRSKPAPKTD